MAAAALGTWATEGRLALAPESGALGWAAKHLRGAACGRAVRAVCGRAVQAAVRQGCS